MAKNSILPALGDMWGKGGSAQLAPLEPRSAYATRLGSLRDLITFLDNEVDIFDRYIHHQLRNDPGHQAIQRIDGVGRVIAAIFCAEIGDISRFSSPKKLCSWSGLAGPS